MRYDTSLTMVKLSSSRASRYVHAIRGVQQAHDFRLSGERAHTVRCIQCARLKVVAMIGARMFLPPERLGLVVSYTDETLPKAMRDQLESYGCDMWFFKARLDGKGTCQSVQTYQAGKRSVPWFYDHEVVLRVQDGGAGRLSLV